MALGKYRKTEEDHPMKIIGESGKVEKNSEGKEMIIYLTSDQTDECEAVRKQIYDKQKSKVGLSYGEGQQLVTAILVAATKRFENLEVEPGVPFELTPENATMLYDEFPSIRDQADYFSGNLAYSPTKKSTPSS